MHVLVSAASKHGATMGIAAHLGRTLSERGLEVTVSKPDGIDDLTEYHAFVVGSAVYAGRWQKDAIELVERLAPERGQRPVWLFSSGPIGIPPKPEEDPVDVRDIATSVEARGHRLFAGKLDKALLGFGERAIVAALHAPAGDFRDWDVIAGWAGEIADALAENVAAER